MALPFPVPASLSPSFVMSRCVPEDTDPLGVVYYESFELDPGNSFWWPPSRDAMMDWMRIRIRKKMSDPGVRHFKITDVGTGDVVSWARWDIPENSKSYGEWLAGPREAVDVSQLVKSGDQEEAHENGRAPEVSAAGLTATDAAPPSSGNPEGADPTLCRLFFDALSRASDKWYTKDMLGLSLLCTAPSYHKRGAAKALLRPMLDIADREGTRTYLEATASGKPVYERLGFRAVDTLDFDLSALTENLKGLYQITIMIRDPQTRA